MESNMAPEYDLLWVIVNYGLGSKVLKVARDNGVRGGTIFFGKGTVDNYWLKLLALNDVRKEIVLLITETSQERQILEALNKKFQFEKPNHGIAFSTSIAKLLGARGLADQKTIEARGENGMYNAIFTIVEKGNAEAVIDAAVAAGSKGGTIINARGAGIHETSKLFSMTIEPEKDIVMILAKEELTSGIVQSIREKLKIDEPGKGILFVQQIKATYGLVD